MDKNPDYEMMEQMSKWFKTLPDGIWGSDTVSRLGSAMGLPSNIVSNQRNRLNNVLLDPTCKGILKVKYNIDAKCSALDGEVKSVHLRRWSALKPVKAITTKKPPKGRDPRLPPVGTWFECHCEAGNVEALEAPEGVFSVALNGNTLPGKARSLTGAVRLILEEVGIPLEHSKNGFKFFNLTEPWTSVPEQRCSCGRGVDDNGDGDCAACAHKDKRCSCGPNDGCFECPTDTTCVSCTCGPNEECSKCTLDSMTGYFLPKYEDVPNITHETRPCVLWGTQVYAPPKGGTEWVASALGGLEARGETPEKALENWDRLFWTGK